MKNTAFCIAVAMATCLLCFELYFRLPWTPTLLTFEFDEQLEYRYAPLQPNAITFLGNYSVQSPRLAINSMGFRGPELTVGLGTNIIVIGSSEVFGPGVAEDHTLPAQLQSLFSVAGTSERVINLGTGGYGPGHHLAVAERALSLSTVNTLIVRVSASDANFVVASNDTIEERKLAKMRRDSIREIAPSSPFLINRLRAQIAPLVDLVSVLRVSEPTYSPDPVTRAQEIWATHSQSWQAIVAAAKEAGTSVVFFVPNGENRDVNSVLCRLLSHNAKDYRVWEYGSETFKVDSAREYRTKFTLGFDPHGNRDRYRVLAEALFSDLQSSSSNRCRAASMRPAT